ncbi:MAG: alpha/beta hydrolase family protein [Balneolaceae bacterium]
MWQRIQLLLIVLLSAPLVYADSPVNVIHILPDGSSISSELPDSIPRVLNHFQALTDKEIRLRAETRYSLHQLPDSKEAWEAEKSELKEKIVQSAGIEWVSTDLPFDLRETERHEREGFFIHDIAFQTLPGVYATANLYRPSGNGPWPAVLVMMGHWSEGKLAGQPIGEALARNGYVAMVIDPWGAGERSSYPGEFEYHGASLGTSLLNVGRSLLGIQVMDNRRAIDFLISRPYVDGDKLGATGASGGGNQTMWLTALDDRIDVSVPVVSVGTFDSYVLGHNCVCEVLPDGLVHSEMAGVLALLAPRALMIHNHNEESNPTFYPSEMLRTYNQLKPLYEAYGAGDKVAYDRFDRPHGYFQENRESLIGWLDLHLKGRGDGSSRPEGQLDPMDEEKLLVYPVDRFDGVETTSGYVRDRGRSLRAAHLNRDRLDPNELRNSLRVPLRLDNRPEPLPVRRYDAKEGWQRLVLEEPHGRLLPLLVGRSAGREPSGEAIVITHPQGKEQIPEAIIENHLRQGHTVVLPDLYGTGETDLSEENNFDDLAQFHTLGRASLWLGETMIGEWTEQLSRLGKVLNQELEISSWHLDATGETGLSALALSALEWGDPASITLRGTPVSWWSDRREGIDHFSMGVHLPGILEWGDVSQLAALSQAPLRVMDPVTLTGQPASQVFPEWLREYRQARERVGNREPVDSLRP